MARQASQGKRTSAAGAPAANPFALLDEGDEEEGAQDDDDNEMAEAVQGCQLGDRLRV